jgi:hypothetical protein
MEPRSSTFREIGRLCSAWAALEMETEATLWGILSLQPSIGPHISWRRDLKSRWLLIVDAADQRHCTNDATFLRKMKKDIIIVSRDRNVIVHGLIHGEVIIPGPRREHGEVIPGGSIPSVPFSKQPCWTIFKGEDKGKSFPVSVDAVRIVHSNIGVLAERLRQFNKTHGYKIVSTISGGVEANWPKPLL